jgi:hypothetical protein
VLALKWQSYKEKGGEILIYKTAFHFMVWQGRCQHSEQRAGHGERGLLQRQANNARKVVLRLKENKFLPHTD